MRLKFLLDMGRPLMVPWNYRTALTGAIYDILKVADKEYSHWLHDEGYVSQNRRYRLFVYSNLRPLHFRASQNGLQTNGSFVWEVASPDSLFVETFLKGLDHRNMNVSLFNVDLPVIDVVKSDLPSIPSNRTWKTISPIVVSTWDGKSKQPIYRNAAEPEFANSLEANLKSKWEAFHQKKWEGDSFGIRVWNPKSTLVPVFNINIRAWYLHLQMWGSEELIRFAYDVGLGEKNSQGFGMIEIGG